MSDGNKSKSRLQGPWGKTTRPLVPSNRVNDTPPLKGVRLGKDGLLHRQRRSRPSWGGARGELALT